MSAVDNKPTQGTEEVDRKLSAHAAHTPGPWFLWDEDTSFWIGVYNEPGRKVIADIATGFDEPFESQQFANAHLIAAAPDLLAALQELVECKQLKDHIDDKDLSAASDEYIEYVRRKRQAWDAARQALGKAKGFP